MASAEEPTVIIRLWRGRVPLERAKEYEEYQRGVGPPGYRVVPGNRGIFMLGRRDGEQYEIAFLTLWESWEAIRAFAGDPVDQAKYYDRDLEFLIDPPEKVEHFEVIEMELPPSEEPDAATAARADCRRG